MATQTLGRLSEEILKMLSGGELSAAKNISQNEIKISIGQVINSLLKTDYVKVNMKSGETIPNGIVMALYEGIAVTQSNGVSKSVLPIKPYQLSRNMGVYGVYPKYTTNGNYETKQEFIPIEMGHGAFLDSQPLINNLLGQTGYECFGNEIIYDKDLVTLYPNITVAMRLAVMDISQYGDYDVLPLLPEHEWLIKQEVVKMYSGVGTPDKLVDSTTKGQQNIPVTQQKQS
jgi:hypothetical protein